MWKKGLTLLAVGIVWLNASFAVLAMEQPSGKLELPVKSAILTEQSSGKILYAENAEERLPPASITKIMTLLLTMEEIASGNLSYTDTVTCTAHASSMGGTQIWLEPGEEMSVDDLLKATAVNSANDASVALAEHISGSEEVFVDRMNRRAAQLGMKQTSFKNATGLDADGHLTTAHDIAIMSRELLKHRDIIKYSTIWTDTLRGGKTGLTNTNKLVRFYEGCTGLKTGTTDGAGHCVAATAKRDGMELIAVVMGAETGNDRFGAARKLLDYGFANYQSYRIVHQNTFEPVPVLRGDKKLVSIAADTSYSTVIPKAKSGKVKEKILLSDSLHAPVERGQTVGKIVVMLETEKLCEIPIKTTEYIGKRSFFSSLRILLRTAFGG